jgi:predicted DNA-binding protein with PD1-like motif
MPNIATMAVELTFGRVFLGSLSGEADLFHFLQRFCSKREIDAGLFSLTGTTRSAIVGIFDPSQQVYASRRETGAFDIVLCTGTILPNGDDTSITAHAVLCGEKGSVSCGRLFSETRVDAAEFEIRELIGKVPERIFDPISARMGLHFL